MLYMGGFLLATGIEKLGLHRPDWPLNIIKFIRNRSSTYRFGIYSCEQGILSMWDFKFCHFADDATEGISGGWSVSDQLGESNSSSLTDLKKYYACIAYSASIAVWQHFDRYTYQHDYGCSGDSGSLRPIPSF